MRSVKFTPSNSFLVSGGGYIVGGGDCAIRVWSIKDKKLLRLFTGHTNTVNLVTISPSGDLLASGSGSYFNGSTAKQDYGIWGVENSYESCKGTENQSHKLFFYLVVHYWLQVKWYLVRIASENQAISIWMLKVGSMLLGFMGVLWNFLLQANAWLLVERFQIQLGFSDGTIKLWSTKNCM